MKKYGLLKYKSYNNKSNIGDYIQSLAAKQFLPYVSEYICREYLDSYMGDSVKIILNGWFLHETKNFPPNANIEPLLISFHLNSDAYSILDDKRVVDFFITHSPIGCRDRETMRRLRSKGVSAYYSGCLTLTLGKDISGPSLKKRETYYFVDPHVDLKRNGIDYFKALFVALPNFPIIFRIAKKWFKAIKARNLITSVLFYYDYKKVFEKEILINAEYVSHIVEENDFSNEEDKFSYAEELLKYYSEARGVITSRIHCALPCLSFNTPVIYINDINKKPTSGCRFDGIIDFFHYVNYDKGKFDLNSYFDDALITAANIKNNKTNFRIIADSLIERCQKFIKDESFTD